MVQDDSVDKTGFTQITRWTKPLRGVDSSNWSLGGDASQQKAASRRMFRARQLQR